MEDTIELKQIKVQQVYRSLRWIAVLIVVLIIGFLAFSYFKVSTEGRLALREAKNVKLALDMIDIQFYGENQSIYDANRRNGLSDSVMPILEKTAEHTGDVVVQAYRAKDRKIISMNYDVGPYRIIYEYSDTKGDQWKVDYMIPLFDYTY